ncbi:MAG: F0F1 ATP synthase subunit epsilon [Myxococcota bacterium]
MADELTLEVVTPDRRFLSAKVSAVVAPGAQGEFGVLPGHVPFMTLLGTGILGYQSSDGTGALVVSRGFAEVRENRVTVLAEAADLADEIDLAKAREDLKALEERLKGKAMAEEEFNRLRAEVERNAAKIHLAGRR